MARLAWGVAALGAGLLAAPAWSGEAAIGANTQAIGPGVRDFAFRDLMKQALPFGAPADPFDSANGPALDAQGWPTQDFGLVLFTGMSGVSGLGGTYRIEFDAFALPFVQAFNSPGRVRSVIRDPNTGRVTVTYDFPEGGDQLAISVTFTSGGGRNVRALRPGVNSDPMFSDAYVAHVSRFDALRFAAWTRADDHPASAWDERATAAEPRYGTALGVPWEACIDLCNAADADLWVNVPHMATDAYVQELAVLVRDRLEAGRNVYVEYSNEVWDPAHAQRQWNLDRAAAEVAGGLVPLDYDGATDPGVWAARRVGEQAVRLGSIFGQAFGPGSLGTRVRPVVAAQTDEPWQFVEAMRYIEAVHGDPASFVHAVAAAPVFDMRGLDADPTLTSGEVLAALELGIERWSGSQELEVVASQAAYFGVGMLAYAGGADTAGPNNIDAKREAALSPGMGSISADAVRAWAADGGGLLMWSVAGAGSFATDAGTFPLTEDLSQGTSKLAAIDAVQGAPMPGVTAGTPVPALIDARRHTLREPGWSAGGAGLGGLEAGDVFEYLVRSDGSRVRVAVRAGSATGGERVGVSVNAGPEREMVVGATGGAGVFEVSGGAFLLDPAPGLSTVRVRAIDGGGHALGAVALACPADVNVDGELNLNDIQGFVDAFLDGTGAGDQDGDGDTDAADVDAFVTRFMGGC